MLFGVEKRAANNAVLGVAFSLALAACAGRGSGDMGPAPHGGVAAEVSDYPVTVGAPYTVDGVIYTPSETLNYDEVGFAGWYGAEQAGNQTANGEIFDPGKITAAHKTLPLPSYVEVTNLDTGRTILVRVNDRGPFATDRLIDLSAAAARQLGMEGQGFVPVRVRRVNPLEQERSLLRGGKMASERIDAPEGLLRGLRQKLEGMPKPKLAAMPVPASASAPPSAAAPAPAPQSGRRRAGRFIIEREDGGNIPSSGSAGTATRPSPEPLAAPSAPYYVVQVAAFSSRERAETLARKVGASVFTNVDGSIWRVRYGPYDTEEEAEAGLVTAHRNGFSSAIIAAGD